ncbi:Starch-binding associating with outer membrane [Sinomicrobium oceani]|uniref:Starch-binding associating with outer membrane n=1 Tax=Sinomicrobium oceani TaxID=1150368 RepID=A0A1K1MAQ2_9FLAO|nr:SusD/RagB family nutrient-binding outer membrane lipoprotein [Sinomicrobium oceani]SFW20181.1 Starch-binding associating with outer membrane [Sinomicrobium oceani]
MLKKSLFLVIALLGLVRCTDNFEEINTNPNDPVNVDAAYLMSSVIVNTAYNLTDENVSGVMGIPSRYITRVIHNGDDTYRWDAESWGFAFNNLINNEDLLRQARAEGDIHLEAIGLIMKGYLFGILTDTFGDVPFENAFGAPEENYTSAYSRQEDIYNTILEYFDRANTLLQEDGRLSLYAAFDPMFEGNVLKWRKLANSLHLRYLLRISQKNEEAFDTIQMILNNNDRYPLILSNDDNAFLPYLGVRNTDSSPLGSYDGDFYDRRPSKVFVDFLLERNDPRLPVWVRPVANPDAGTVDNNEYVGLPLAVFGATNYNGTTNHLNYESSNYSEFSSVFHDDSNSLFNAVIFPACETYFILAELVEVHKLNYGGTSAGELYLEGIHTSMSQYRVEAEAEATDYYTQPLVAYDGTLEQILAQKWVSMLFVGGSETWFDHRRTGYPVFPFGDLSIRDEIPFRMPYPADEASYNAENYEQAIENQGWSDDSNYEKMWLLK